MEVTENQKIISDTTAKVSAISALPLPFIDIAGMTYFQYNMVEKLAAEHKVTIDKTTNLIISSIISALISKVVTTGLINLSQKTKLDKMLKDSLLKASICGFMTTIIGEVYELHFKNAGTLEDISIASFITYFDTQFKSDRWTLSALADDFMGAVNEFTV